MRHPLKIGLAMLGLLAALPGFALYKVVGPDGKVSYTDRPPQDSTTKVQGLPSAARGPSESATLPFELRQVVQRFPVTYYTTANCAPCDSGRALLRQRGIPYTEKSVTSTADREAFARLGTDRLPLLQIGKEQVSGFLASEWNRHLDAAGYPAQSRLPSHYPFAPATALAGAGPAASAVAASAPGATPRPTSLPAAPRAADASGAPPGFRF